MSGIIPLGIPVSLTTKLSSLSVSKDNYQQIFSYLKYFRNFLFLFSISIILPTLIFYDDILYFLTSSIEFKYFFIITLAAIPFLVQIQLIETYLKSVSNIKRLVQITVFNTVLSTGILIILINVNLLIALCLYAASNALIPFALFIILEKRNFFTRSRSVDSSLKFSDVKNLFKLGIVSLFSSLMYQSSLLIIRKYTIDYLGYDSNGIYQSVLGVSINAFSVIYIFLGNYSLPKFSKIESSENLFFEVNQSFRFLMFILLPVVLVILTFKFQLIELFYSEKFLKAIGLFPFQVIGDLFRALGALFGLWLIVKMKIKTIMIIDLIMNFILIFLPLGLFIFVVEDLIFLSVGYLIAFFTHFLLNFLFFRTKTKFKFTKESIRIIIISFFILLFAIINSIFLSNFSVLFFIVSIILFFTLSLTVSERTYIYNKLKSKF